MALLGGLGLEPDVPDISEVLDDVMLHVGAAVVLAGLPSEAGLKVISVGIPTYAHSALKIGVMGTFYARPMPF